MVEGSGEQHSHLTVGRGPLCNFSQVIIPLHLSSLFLKCSE